jgi:hypothetical protein
LGNTLSELHKILEIVLTTSFNHGARILFSTVKIINIYLRNSMGQERLNTLAVLSIHKDVISVRNDFLLYCLKVRDHFAKFRGEPRITLVVRFKVLMAVSMKFSLLGCSTI